MSVRGARNPESDTLGLFCPSEEQEDYFDKVARENKIDPKEFRKIISIYFRANTNNHPTLIGSFSKADEDAFSENLKPTIPNGVFRFFIIPNFSSGSPKLNVVIDTPQKQDIKGLALSGDVLTTATAYTFDVQTKAGLEYNLQATADLTWDLVLVTELTP